MVRKSCDVMCPVLGRCGRYDLSSLITISALDRTVCHAVHHEALQRNKHRQNRDNENQCTRHHCAHVGTECSVHCKKSECERLFLWILQERRRDQKLVPRVESDDDSDGNESGSDDRNHHASHEPKRVHSIHYCCLFDLYRHAEEKGTHEEGGEWHIDGCQNHTNDDDIVGEIECRNR